MSLIQGGITPLISEAMMTSEDEFIFGNGFKLKQKTFTWSANKRDFQNGHMLIVGGSGSGKTRLLKKIIKYLYNDERNYVYSIDFHGDMIVDGGISYKFSLRNSKYGLNPFEMEMDEDNGGPIAQANIVLSNFKKNFIPNMGAVQRNTFRRILIDTYRYVGILDEDTNTWSKPLPTLSTLIELYRKISTILKSGNTNVIVESLQRLERIKKAEGFTCKDCESDLMPKKVEKAYSDFCNEVSRYQEYMLGGKYREHFEREAIENVETDFYFEPANLKAFQSLYPYLDELSNSSVFNDNRPPKAKRVRYDISGFTNADKPSEAMFFAYTVIQKIFRGVKMRGEFRKKSYAKGRKADTYVIIDESKLILPTGKDKENPYNILNRVVTEARKYGMCLIIVSQRPGHFPEEMISSIYTKVILKVDGDDVKAAMKSLGIKEASLFNDLNKNNVALVGNTGSLYESVLLPYNM